MEIKQIDLNVEYETIGLKKPTNQPKFKGYILKNIPEGEIEKHPAVIICPGGAYRWTSHREATPVALEYLSKGISAFILDYSCAPNTFPVALTELATAVATVRRNAEDWNIMADNITVVGFSAGGHLTASLGVFWQSEMMKELGFTDEMHKPNALILAYPVISTGKYKHEQSFRNLLGDKYEDKLECISLENCVTKNCPRTFIWHTYEDDSVPVANSVLFASALIENKVKTEMHIYPHGGHGLSTGTGVMNKVDRVFKNLDTWIGLSVDFIFNK